MKAYVVDPDCREVYEIELEHITSTNRDKAIRELEKILQCKYIADINVSKHHTLLIDDSGLTGDLTHKKFWAIDGVTPIIGGKGILMGRKGENECAPYVGIDSFRSSINWLTYEECKRHMGDKWPPKLEFVSFDSMDDLIKHLKGN